MISSVIHLSTSMPGGSVVKRMPANARDTGDMGLIPGSGRSLAVGNGNAHQCSCLGNSMDRGAWRATVHGITELDTTEPKQKEPVM